MSTPSTSTTFTTALVGQAESALRAILDRELAGTGLSAPQWMTLTVTIVRGGSADRDQLVHQLAGVRKVSEPEARAYIDQLITARLLEASGDEHTTVNITDSGRQLHGQIRNAIAHITRRLWGDLSAAELATAGRVLSTVLARANSELARHADGYGN